MDGLSRVEAARLAGMERQALRDVVVRYNAEGLAGLHDRPRSGRKPRLTEAEQIELAKLIKDGPHVEASGLSARTLADQCAEIKQRWDKILHPASLSRVVRELGFSRQKARQVHPQAARKLRMLSKKGASGGGRDRPFCSSRQAPDAVVRGRSPRRPERAHVPSLVDAWLAAAWLVRSAIHLGAHARGGAGSDRQDFCLVMPPISTAGDENLARTAQRHACRRRTRADGDGRCRRGRSGELDAPDNVSLVILPAYSPALNPIERVWLDLGERHLSHRLLDNYDGIVDACCTAWNKLTAERPQWLTSYLHLEQVRCKARQY